RSGATRPIVAASSLEVDALADPSSPGGTDGCDPIAHLLVSAPAPDRSLDLVHAHRHGALVVAPPLAARLALRLGAVGHEPRVGVDLARGRDRPARLGWTHQRCLPRAFGHDRLRLG